MALDDPDMLLMDDFSSAGLAAAELTEQGHVDAAEEILRINILGTADPELQQTAQDILARLDAPSDDHDMHGLRVKRRSLELMLIDGDMSEEQKDEFVERYSNRSVRHLALMKTRPKLAKSLEFLDDVVKGSNRLYQWSKKSLWFVGDSVIRGTVYGLLGPTGLRKYFEYAKNSKVSQGKTIYTRMSMVVQLSFTGGFATSSFILHIMGQGEYVSLVAQAAMYLWAGSGAYELARLAKRVYDRRSEKSLPATSIAQLPEQVSVKARVGLDHDDNDMPVDGYDGRMRVNDIMLKKRVAGE